MKLRVADAAARRVSSRSSSSSGATSTHADSLVVEATGSRSSSALLEMLNPYGVRELVQSGMVAVAHGSGS